jgi:hypothetical protein
MAVDSCSSALARIVLRAWRQLELDRGESVSIKKPYVGAMVQFVDGSRQIAAMVTRVHTNGDSWVDLTVFYPGEPLRFYVCAEKGTRWKWADETLDGSPIWGI